MSIIDTQSKNIMVQAMRNVLESRLVQTSGYLSESKIVRGIGFVNESATYEQLLNLTLNPNRETKYLPAHILEGAAAILYSACLTGRNKIGPRAIAEGAAILQDRTGCVITESMLDAAYDAVKGGGLDVIGEAYYLSEANASKTGRANKKENAAYAKTSAFTTGAGMTAKEYEKLEKERALRDLEKFAVDGSLNPAFELDKKTGKLKKRKVRKPRISKKEREANLAAHAKNVEARKAQLANALDTPQVRLLKKRLEADRRRTGRKNLAIGAGAGLGAAALAAGTGYGIYRWLKNKKKNKKAE